MKVRTKYMDETLEVRVSKHRGRGLAGLADAVRGKSYDVVISKPRRDNATLKLSLIAQRGPTCEACSTVMPSPGLVHLHHIVPVAAGGKDTVGNCALLCPNCHAKAHWLYRRLGPSEIPTNRAELMELLHAA